MSALERLLAGVLLLILLLVGGWFGIHHYGAGRYDAGYAAAVDAGKAQHDRETATARQTETDLRAELRAKDEQALESERTYEISLDVAQRRMRAGTDRLRCPASPVQPSAAPGDRSPAPAPAADGQGPELMPEASADVLGVAADIAGLVRRYAEVEERHESCRTVNAK